MAKLINQTAHSSAVWVSNGTLDLSCSEHSCPVSRYSAVEISRSRKTTNAPQELLPCRFPAVFLLHHYGLLHFQERRPVNGSSQERCRTWLSRNCDACSGRKWKDPLRGSRLFRLGAPRANAG